MRIHSIKTNEYTLLTSFSLESICFNEKIPVAHNDKLIFLIDDKFAGISTIHTIINKEDELTLKVSFEQILLNENRLSIFDITFGNILNVCINSNFYSFSNEDSAKINTIIQNLGNDFGFMISNIDSLLEEAKEVVEIDQINRARTQNHLLTSSHDFELHDEHQKAQFLLNEIGHICSLRTWTASNDKNRTYKGAKLGQFDTVFPELDISTDAQQRIELIDNIWIKEKRPVCAFEVETTTTIYSGLLRLADLITVLSSSNLHLYIVAPKERIKKFIKEIQRPLFKSVQLEKHCFFISIESLEILYQKIKGLNGHVDYKVLDVIHQSSQQLEKIHFRGELT